MTEAKWLEWSSPDSILDFLGSKASDRKLRLFACASCRRIWHLLHADARAGIETSEKYADGLVSKAEMKTAWQHIHAPPSINHRDLTNRATNCAIRAASVAAQLGHRQTKGAWFWSGAARWEKWASGLIRVDATERSEQSALLRHIIGNPFRPYPASDRWPTAVVQVAESLYTGTDCAFALHDALLEAGHAELAEHFVKEQWHPKGCWVVDLILGKK
jgi:hypothetical protein